MTLVPAIQLASSGVQWAPTLGIASIGAGVSSVFLAIQGTNGVVPKGAVFLAAGLAWASPLLALSEVLLSSRAGWRDQGADVSFRVTPTHQGGSATMTWRF
jgi:hypothetical protein